MAEAKQIQNLFLRESIIASTKNIEPLKFTEIDDRWQWDGQSFDGEFDVDRSDEWRTAASMSPEDWESQRETREERWGYLIN